MSEQIQKFLPSWLYQLYGLLILLPAFGILIYGIITILFSIDIGGLSAYIILIIAIIVIAFPGMAYLIIAHRKRMNRLTDLSIKIGIIPLLILIFFEGSLALYEEFTGITIFPENYMPFIIGLIAGIILLISLIFLLIGFIISKIKSKKRKN